MQNKIPAVVMLLLAAVLGVIFVWGDAGPTSLYKDFRLGVKKSDAEQRELLRQRQTAVPSAREIIAVVGPAATRSPGAIVVGLIDRNRQLILGWGKDGSGKDASGDTIFETASVSKAFAGLLLAQMVQRGEVALEEPVESLAGMAMPCMDGKQITLRQLATHSSGLPPWPDNRGDTTAPYSHRDLCGYLRQASLMGPPDSGVMYSNTAFALLGDLLAGKAGTTFDGLLKKRICTPLGMHHTQVGLPDDEQENLAVGHWADGSPAHASAPTAGGAADGVRSSVRDLLRFASAYIGVQPTDFGAAMDMSSKSYLGYSEKLDAGLGWFIDVTDNSVEKSGHIAGYRSNITFSPEHKVAVVVLAGWEAFPSPKIGKSLLNLMIQRRQLIESGAILE